MKTCAPEGATAAGGDVVPPPDEPARRPWRGRIFYFVGLILMALTLRHAVTGVSPLLGRIEQDITLGAVGLTVLGMLPTIAFGLAGFIAPNFIRRFGPATIAVAAMLLGAFGTIARVLGDSPFGFLLFGLAALFGMGMGNVVGPPLVKRYFPDRSTTAMSVLTLMTQAGATIPAFLAVPMADLAGWRVAVGSYASLMLVAALPWTLAAMRSRSDARDRPAADQTASAPPSQGFGARKLFTDPISLGGAIFYGMAALNTYAMLAWLPTIFQAQGLSESAAAQMYSIYTFLTLPMALITPIIASKMSKPFLLGALFPLASAIGYIGIIAAPSAGALWAVIAGLSGGAFPFAMVMFNRQTRTPEGSAAVTGFSLGIGYAFGTVGPFLGGLLSTLTGGWTVPLLVLAATAVVMVLGAQLLTRDRAFEDVEVVAG